MICEYSSGLHEYSHMHTYTGTKMYMQTYKKDLLRLIKLKCRVPSDRNPLVDGSVGQEH